MARLGTVISINGKYAEISTSRRGVCDGCSDKSTCSFDSALGKATPEIITAINAISAKPGDSVEFDLTGHNELKFSLIVWVIPLIGLVIGAFIGSRFFNTLSVSHDTGTLIGLVLGFLVAFSLVVVFEKKVVSEKQALPLLLKIIKNGECHKQI